MKPEKKIKCNIITSAYRSRCSSETHQVIKTFRIVQKGEVSLLRVAYFWKRWFPISLCRAAHLSYFGQPERTYYLSYFINRDRTTQTAIYWDSFWLQSFGTRNKSLANAKAYLLLYSFILNLRTISEWLFIVAQKESLEWMISPGRTLRYERRETTAPQNSYYNSNTHW